MLGCIHRPCLDGDVSNRTFTTLDGMRGVAALAVVAFHAAALSGPLSPRGGYLAVDFFFLLSGFVLEHAYGSRLATGLGPRAFMGIRLVRLYPLYLAGTLIGLGCNAIAFTLVEQHFDVTTLVQMAAGPLLFFPSVTGPGGSLYPLDGPAWSLLAELAVNFGYALAWRWLDRRALMTVILVSAALLAAGIVWHGSADLGAKWSSFVLALPRVAFSFFLGVLIYRTVDARPRPTRLAGLVPAIFVLLLFVDFGNRPLDDSLAIFIAFPALLILGARSESPRPAVLTALGGVSYALYATHYPVLETTQLVSWWLTGEATATAPWAILASFGAILGVAWVLSQYYDQPARSFLRALLSAGRPPRADPTPVVPRGKASRLSP